jgi:hypothetical protein
MKRPPPSADIGFSDLRASGLLTDVSDSSHALVGRMSSDGDFE